MPKCWIDMNLDGWVLADAKAGNVHGHTRYVDVVAEQNIKRTYGRFAWDGLEENNVDSQGHAKNL